MSKILVVHCDGLGDAVFSIPFLTILPEQYPNADIYIIISLGRRDLYLGLKKYIVVEENEIDKINEILENEYDIIFDLNGDRHLTDYFTNLNIRYQLYVGFRKSLSIKNEIQVPIVDDVPRWKEYLNFIPELTKPLEWNGHYNLVTSKESKDLRRLLFSVESRRKVICIAPGSAKAEKRWPAQYFAEVINFLKSRIDYRVVLLGNFWENKIGEEITSSSKYQVDNLIGITPLGCAIEVIKCSGLVLANDSGLYHLSRLLEIPAIGLYGPTDPFKWSISGAESHVIKSNTDKIEDIFPSRVIDECLAILKI